MSAADRMTFFRILLSPLLLFLAPLSVPFTAVYLLCGASDVLDGQLARRTHTVSKRGAMLDSIADLELLLICLVRLLPLWELPVWLWIWMLLIALMRAAAVLLGFVRTRRLILLHTGADRLTGGMLFAAPLLRCDIRLTAVPICLAATAAGAEEIRRIMQYGRGKEK